jgi:hypothetical protein
VGILWTEFPLGYLLEIYLGKYIPSAENINYTDPSASTELYIETPT